MEIMFLLIPLSVSLVGVAIWAFFWAIKSGQFDDLDSPSLSILDEERKPMKNATKKSTINKA
jgi:cbb3-type cytochrome oxidase maturation protein